MPSAPAEDGPCSQFCGSPGRALAKALPRSALLAASFTEELARECDRPVRGVDATMPNGLKKTGLCSFQRVRVCLLGESHPGFRKGAGSRGT